METPLWIIVALLSIRTLHEIIESLRFSIFMQKCEDERPWILHETNKR